jgi:hypothetical protein
MRSILTLRWVTRASLAMAALTYIGIGAEANVAGPTEVLAYATKADFDGAFSEAAAGHRELQGFRVNRAQKTNRLPIGKGEQSVPASEPRSTLPDGCEPLAAPYADPLLGRVISRCIV